MLIFVIKKIRKSKNISLNKLSIATGISRAYLFDLENNRRMNPTFSVLERISEVLNVNIKELFYTKLDIDALKGEMYARIKIFGMDSEEVLEISQIIDLLVNIDMQSKNDS